MQWNDSDVARFESKVDRTGDCHLWTGAKMGRGRQYGYFSLRNKLLGAHRFAYLLANGPDSIPPGHFVLHNCPGGDNPSCVNSAHLWTGTAAQNSADMVAKGRAATGDRNSSRLYPRQIQGEKNPMAKLSESDIPKVKKLRASGMLQREIGKLFNVRSATIGKILAGKRWKHVK